MPVLPPSQHGTHDPQFGAALHCDTGVLPVKQKDQPGAAHWHGAMLPGHHPGGQRGHHPALFHGLIVYFRLLKLPDQEPTSIPTHLSLPGGQPAAVGLLGSADQESAGFAVPAQLPLRGNGDPDQLGAVPADGQSDQCGGVLRGGALDGGEPVRSGGVLRGGHYAVGGDREDHDAVSDGDRGGLLLQYLHVRGDPQLGLLIWLTCHSLWGFQDNIRVNLCMFYRCVCSIVVCAL